MKLLYPNDGEKYEKIIIRLDDGTIVTLTKEYLQMKNLPGRRKTEKKRMEYKDLVIVNDALRRIYPLCECNSRCSE